MVRGHAQDLELCAFASVGLSGESHLVLLDQPGEDMTEDMNKETVDATSNTGGCLKEQVKAVTLDETASRYLAGIRVALIKVSLLLLISDAPLL